MRQRKYVVQGIIVLHLDLGLHPHLVQTLQFRIVVIGDGQEEVVLAADLEHGRAQHRTCRVLPHDGRAARSFRAAAIGSQVLAVLRLVGT